MERALPDATSTSDPPGGERAGRYELFAEIGSGGMAKVHLGRLIGAAGFARTVAIKRPLPALTRDVDFRRTAINEARLAARVQHPHVVSTLDVVEHGDELLIVMEYVHGESLAALAAEARERGARLPPGVVVSLVAGALRGLQAVHEARDERGNLLGLIHRDVSPQNVLVGVEGLARLSDFGLAKAAGGISLTGHDEFKGKLTYASPEQLGLRPLSPATDLYSMGLVLWELLVGERLYAGLTAAEIVARLLAGGHVSAPSRHVEGIPSALDAVVERATRFEPTERFESAQEMAAALEACASPAPVGYVAAWVRSLAAGPLIERERHLLMAERQTTPSKLGASLAPEIAQGSTEAPPAMSPEGSPGTSPEAVPEGGSPLTTLVSAQPVPKPPPPFEFALTMPVGPLVSPVPAGLSGPPGPLRSSVPPPPAGPFAPPVPPRRFVSSVPPRSSVAPPASGVGSTLASAGTLTVSPADLGDRARLARPVGAFSWANPFGWQRPSLGGTLARLSGALVGVAVAFVVAKIVLPPVGGSTPVEASSPPVLLAAPSIVRVTASAEAAASAASVEAAARAASVEAAASAASVEVAALPVSGKPTPVVAPSASALPRKRRPFPRGRDEERVPRRERCSPPFSIDADGIRHMKPGCQ